MYMKHIYGSHGYGLVTINEVIWQLTLMLQMAGKITPHSSLCCVTFLSEKI